MELPGGYVPPLAAWAGQEISVCACGPCACGLLTGQTVRVLAVSLTSFCVTMPAEVTDRMTSHEVSALWWMSASSLAGYVMTSAYFSDWLMGNQSKTGMSPMSWAGRANSTSNEYVDIGVLHVISASCIAFVTQNIVITRKPPTLQWNTGSGRCQPSCNTTATF